MSGRPFTSVEGCASRKSVPSTTDARSSTHDCTGAPAEPTPRTSCWSGGIEPPIACSAASSVSYGPLTTAWISSRAVDWMMSSTRDGSLIPGSSTRISLSPSP